MEETKKSKVNFIIYIIVCVVVAISSFFMGYQYGKNPQTVNNQISSSYAVGDISDGTFISSNFYIPMNYCHGLYSNYYAFGYDDDIWVVSLRFSLSYSSINDNYTFGLLDNDFFDGGSLNNRFNYIYWGLTNSSLAGQNMPYYKILDNSNPNYFLKYSNTAGQNGFMFSVSVDSQFDTSNVVGVSITKQKSVESFIEYEAYDDDGSIVHDFGLIDFDYFDINGKHFFIQVCGVQNWDLDKFIDRTYYFDRDNNGYDYGYSIGYQEGESAGTTAGYNSGYSTGYNVGDSVGYNRGLQAANDYSFLGLISAVVDAPITIFKGLFNFSIFGTNMGQFLLSLASITLVIVIVRFVLARKE